MLTRARLLPAPTIVLAVLVAGLLIARCGEAPALRIEGLVLVHGTPQPRSAARDQSALRVSAPASLHGIVQDATTMLSEQGAPALRLVTEGTPAELRVAFSERPGFGPVLRWWSVVSAAARLDLTDVSSERVAEAARNGLLYVRRDDLELARLLLDDHATLIPLPEAEVAARLHEQSGSLALLPLEAVSVRVRALALDGRDPVRGSGDLSAYPLVTRATVDVIQLDARRQVAALALAEALHRPPPVPITLAFTGDLIPTRCVYDQLRRANDWTAPFKLVGERLRAAAITIGSLDAAISDKGQPIGCRETYNLLAPPQVVEGFQAAGFDVITVATNHVKDCGSAGSCGDAAFLDTLSNLKRAGIESVGGGVNLAAARAPALVTAGGVRFAFLGYDDIAAYNNAREDAPGTAPLDLETLAADVRAARAVADVVVVLPQWGEEYTPHPTARQQQAARVAVDAGAALVAGNHPHVVQAAGPLANGYVAYALGNFVFDQDWSVETTEGVILEATFHGSRLVAVQFVPVRIRARLQPAYLDASEGLTVLRRMMQAAAKLTPLR